MKGPRISFTAAIFALLAVIQAQAIDYIPFNGREGYQEISISPDLYFVAFHGKMHTSASDIEAAWKTRAAQLCVAGGAEHFVELYYSFEPVLKDDKPPFNIYGVRSTRVVAPIFPPINISGTSVAKIYDTDIIDAPSRQAHVRCVHDAAQAISPEWLVETGRIIEDAKARGWITSSAR